MSMSDAQSQYVRTMTSYVKLYNQSAGISDNCVVAIVAQSCNESNWGKSQLSAKYYNFWGMKCGSHWTGKSVNMRTSEETPEGYIKVSSDFRVYDSWQEGVAGYFEFISTTRYQNLKTATTPYEYLTLIKEDGWATSSSYVSDIMKIVNQIQYLVDGTGGGSDPQPPQPDKPWGPVPSTYSTLTQVALQVLNGLWGSISDKENLEYKLSDAGYDYHAVMVRMYAIIGSRKELK